MVNKWTVADKINVRQLLSEVDQYAAWGKIVGRIVGPTDKFTNPFRSDKNPGCTLSEYAGVVRLTDWADPSTHGMNLVDAYRKAFGLGFREACSAIYTGNTGAMTVSKTTVDRRTKLSRECSFVPRNFNRWDKEYWSKRGISKDNLVTDKVIPLSRFTIAGVTYEALEHTYAFVFPSGRFKVYQPFSDKRMKWFGNMTKEDYWFIDDFLSQDLVITKGYKEHRIIHNLLQDVCTAAFNGEGYKHIPERLSSILGLYKRIWVLYDNDAAGKRGCSKTVELIQNLGFDAKCVYLPPDEPKDVDHIMVDKGERYTRELLKSILV